MQKYLFYYKLKKDNSSKCFLKVIFTLLHFKVGKYASDKHKQ